MLLLLPNSEAITALFVGSFAVGLSVLYAVGKLYDLLWVLLFPITWIHERINRWRFLLNAPKMIQDGYDKANGAPFVVNSPDVGFTFVASKKFIKEIDNAPDSVLSLQAAAKVVLQPQYSMAKFNWFEQRGIDGTPLPRMLRSLLTNNLPQILPESRLGNSAIMDDMYEMKDRPHVSKMIRDAVAHTNALAFFGKELAHNKDFMADAIDFIEKTIIIAEVVRLLPSFIAPSCGRLMASYFKAHKVIHETLVPVAEERLAERAQKKLGHKVPEHKDCIQWVMEQSAKTGIWTAERIIHELMALWFGSVHSMAMSVHFAIHDICLHPEYVQPLREEFEGPAYKFFESTGNGLPLIDSFLKESARLSPLDALSTRRKALQPFSLSDGTHIQQGQWICTPLKAMMRDEANWTQALEFHGFRHVDPSILAAMDSDSTFQSPQPEKALPITDVTEWQVWGTGRMACPGRFYAVAGMKQIFGLILTKYDCELVDTNAQRLATWRTCHVPKASTPIVLRTRAGAA